MRTDELLIPVGHDLGVMWSGDGGERRQQVRIGTEVAEITDRDFAVWMLAHGARWHRRCGTAARFARP